MTPNVLIVQRRLTEYRVALFERLRTVLAERGIRLSVVHGTAASEELPRGDEGSLSWAVRTRTWYLRVAGRRISWVRNMPFAARQQDLVVVTHENGIASNYPLFVRALVGGPAIAWWGHGPKLLDARVRRLERLKAISATWGRRYFAYTAESVRRVSAAGVPSERITCLNNAVSQDEYPSSNGATWRVERERLRSELEIGTGPVAIYLGSFTPEKRIPQLLSAADELHRRIHGFSLILIGDGPLRSVVQRAAETRPWLHLLGVRHGRDKLLACSLGEVMLNPGMVGLNIVDAFAMGLPIVTMRHDLHSPEIAYLEDGRNGLLVDDSEPAFVSAAERVLTDPELRARLKAGCEDGSRHYTLDNMASNFVDGIERSIAESRPQGRRRNRIPRLTVAAVIRTFLPYHVARFARLREMLERVGIRLVEIEVASQDAAYAGFNGARAEVVADRWCCFPGTDYQSLSAGTVHAAVLRVLQHQRPDVVLAHATPFPEGMAAITYRNRYPARVFVVDDAWGPTDVSGAVVRKVKRLIHRSVDGAIVPSEAHARHQETLGIAFERSAIGWSVVDNEFFARQAAVARREADAARARLRLPPRFFLFVGRFLERKGIATLLEAHRAYAASTTSGRWPLVLVGGTERELAARGASAADVVLAGQLFGVDLAHAIALAEALVVPSYVEQWGLVVNEALASGTPVIASRACGAAQLIREGITGYTFHPGDAAALAEVMGLFASVPESARAEMALAAQRAISEWGLDRFAAAVTAAIDMPRRMPGGLLSDLAVRLWKGRVRAY